MPLIAADDNRAIQIGLRLTSGQFETLTLPCGVLRTVGLEPSNHDFADATEPRPTGAANY